jgi:N-acetylmuramoyl-L-alanine amidase
MSVHFKNFAPQIFAIRVKMGLGNRVGSIASKNSHKISSCQKVSAGRIRSLMLVPGLFISLILCLSLAHAQETNQQAKRKPTIVLDPGHGGLDNGARGPENVTEKNIVMALARAMTERLKASYRIILTRKDDYQVSVFSRTAIANHHQADLFVSIHTGASYRSNPRGVSVFYYEGIDGQSVKSRLQNDLRVETSQTIQIWEQQRSHHSSKSRYFVDLLKKRLSNKIQDLKFYSGSAPLVVLAGARMPAVLIEIGHITNPMDAKALNDESMRTVLAEAICDAIDDFFSDDLSL